MGTYRPKKCRRCYRPLYRCNCAYQPRSHEQYLDSDKLRSNLGANGHGGEAHHIIPGNIVEEKKWVDKKIAAKDFFNEAWNGIMLNGTRSPRRFYIINRLSVNKYNLSILHRKGGQRSHSKYDNRVRALIDKMNIKNRFDCEFAAHEIKNKIMFNNADSLDDLMF